MLHFWGIAWNRQFCAAYIPYLAALDFEKLQFEIPSLMNWIFSKEGWIEDMACWLVSGHQDRNPGAQILAVWSQTDLQPVKQNLCLAPDQKMALQKKIANDLKINLAP